MTKSVKEKNRLSSIKKHQIDGTRVTSDLLKIKMCYKANPYIDPERLKDPKKYLVEKHSQNILKTIYNSKWMKNHFSDFPYKKLEKKLIDISNTLNIYELIINPFFRYHADDGVMTICLSLYDKNKKYIGYINANSDSYENYFDKYIDTTDDKKILIKKINRLLKYTSNKNYELIFTEKNAAQYINRNHKNYLTERIKYGEVFFHNYLKYLNLNIELLEIKYRIGRSIYFSLFLRTDHKLNNILHIESSQTKIDLIIDFMFLGILKINIPVDDLLMENITEIESIIRIQNY